MTHSTPDGGTPDDARPDTSTDGQSARATRWTSLRVRLVADDALIRAEVGSADLTYDEAHAAVQRELDVMPGAARLADQWRDVTVGETVYVPTVEGMALWVLVEHDGDPVPAANLWLEDYAERIRATGMPVQVARVVEVHGAQDEGSPHGPV